MAVTSSLVRVTLVLYLTSITSAQTNCPLVPDMTVTEKLEAAQIVLYGRETTVLPPCPGDTGQCSRTDIDFAVHCVLKNVAGASIPAAIAIKGDGQLDACDGTHFPYDQTPGEWPLVVMVTIDSTGTFRWDEVEAGESAYFDHSEQLASELDQVCWPGDWSVPSNAADGASCPPRQLLTLSWPRSSGANGGDLCCVTMGHGPVQLQDGCSTVGHSLAWSAPGGIAVGECGDSGELWTVVGAEEPADFSALSIHWLVTNLPCRAGSLALREGTLEQAYQTPWLSDGTTQGNKTYSFYTYKHTAPIPSPLRTGVDNTCFWCSYDMNALKTSNSMSLHTNYQLTVTPDIATTWELYINHGWSHADACLEFDPTLQTIGDFAVCPAPVQPASGGGSVAACSGVVWLLYVACGLYVQY